MAVPQLEINTEHAQEATTSDLHGNIDFIFPSNGSPNLDFLDGVLDVDGTLNLLTSPSPAQSDTRDGGFTTPPLPCAPTAATSIEMAFPESRSPCECVRPTESSTKNANMWSSMSQTLMDWKAQHYQPHDHPTPHQHHNYYHHHYGSNNNCSGFQLGENHDDIAVRAVTEGWDAPSLGNLSISWRILLQVDQKVWAKCRPVDRLAVLSIMNRLLQVRTIHYASQSNLQ